MQIPGTFIVDDMIHIVLLHAKFILQIMDPLMPLQWVL